MAADVLGIVAIVFFYALIFVVGVLAGRKQKSAHHNAIDAEGAQATPALDQKRPSTLGTEQVMLAGRNIGTMVGIFTMTATWVGGAYINGTAEVLYTSGILGCQAPVGYALSLVVGGLLFAKPMREKGYITMLDPFQIKYGQRVGGLMFVPALLGEVFWSAAILSALGATLSVILQWDMTASVLFSALIAVGYTFWGGLYAVAYTDVIQLFCIFVGLWVCVPAAVLQNKTRDLRTENWVGSVGGFKDWAVWWDCMLLLVFGGIPWQVYFQRVLSSRTSTGAQRLSFAAGVGCLLMAIPPALIGAIARNTDWSLTEYQPWGNGTKSSSIPADQTNMVVPLVFQYLTPKWVSFIGLGAVSAAVMSSADSSVLSAASMFAHNIWKLTIRPCASEREVIAVMRVGIVAVGVLATIMALTIHSIYGLWYLCADLVYVILFPQLLCVVHVPDTNTYGSLAGYAVGLLLRLSGGEPLLGMPAFVEWPGYENEKQYFPFRTAAMLASLATLIWVLDSNSARLPPEWDVLGCVVNLPTERIALGSEIEFTASCETLTTASKNSTNGLHNNNNNNNTEGGLGERSRLHPNASVDYATVQR